MPGAAVIQETGDLTARKVDFLSERLAFHIADFKGKRNRSRAYAGIIKFMLIIFGGITTIILGIKEYAYFAEHKTWMEAAALILSASGSMLVAIEALTNNTWRWIRYRRTLYDLYAIQDDLRYVQAGSSPVPDDKIEALYKRLCAALDAYNDEWLKERARSLTEFTGVGGTSGR